jgi:hypothetical protein
VFTVHDTTLPFQFDLPKELLFAFRVEANGDNLWFVGANQASLR